jgi:hypothetical protein
MSKAKKRSNQPNKGPQTALERLFSNRYHGAANHKAVLYHALYSSISALGMYDESGTDQVVNEGLEDVDLFGSEFGHSYVQLKNQAGPMTLPQVGKVLASFAEVLRADQLGARIAGT